MERAKARNRNQKAVLIPAAVMAAGFAVLLIVGFLPLRFHGRQMLSLSALFGMAASPDGFTPTEFEESAGFSGTGGAPQGYEVRQEFPIFLRSL